MAIKNLGALVFAAAGVCGLLGMLTAAPPPPADGGKGTSPQMEEELPPPKEMTPRQTPAGDAPARPTTRELPQVKGNIMGKTVATVDLAAALKLAGIQNTDIVLARQYVLDAVAIRQLAAAQFLPMLNAGLNYDSHIGPVQQSSGNILNESRQALYVGAGTNAVAAGTVNIPGVFYNANVSEVLFKTLAAKQLISARRFANLAVRNEQLRRVAVAYTNLLREEGRRAVAYQNRVEAEEARFLTKQQAKTELGLKADDDRVANEVEWRTVDLLEDEARVQRASAELAEVLNLDPSIRLHPAEERVVPMPIVPDTIPLPELLAIALLQRPELAERQAEIRQAMLFLSSAKLLPFSPQVLIGLSGGTFGGGSNIVATTGGFGAAGGQSYFGNFGPRNDFDVIAYWTLQNLGVGNQAIIRQSASKLREAELQKLATLNQVRAEVANTYIRIHVRFAQIAVAEDAVRAGLRAFKEDYIRVFNGRDVGLPIELMASLHLLVRAREQYLNAIVDYNQSQLELYVALGQPPAAMLARPVPRDFTPPPQERPLPKDGPPR
jgi:outer membrane protein TolC